MSKVLPQMMSTMASTAKTMTSSSAQAKQQQIRPKRVEVRWLESEAELYLKQWQHRYHQLESLDNNYQLIVKNGRQLNGSEELADNWCLTTTNSKSKTISYDLDIDFDKINKNQNKGNHKKTVHTFDHFFWRSDDNCVVNSPKNNKRFKTSNVFGFDDNSVNKSLSLSSTSAVDEEDMEEMAGHVVKRGRGRRRPIDTTEEDDESAAEDSFENMRITSIKRFNNKNNNKNKNNNSFNRNKNDLIISEKERQFSIDLNKRLELLAKDQCLATDGESPVKSRPPKARQRDRTRPPRPRPPPIRRQIFKCEHVGCSYQSDRNFNFLRHKRTHRKTKPDGESITSAELLADICGQKPKTKPIVNQNNDNKTNDINTELIININKTSITSDTSSTSINTSTNAPTDENHNKMSNECHNNSESCDKTNEKHLLDENNQSYHQKMFSETVKRLTLNTRFHVSFN